MAGTRILSFELIEQPWGYQYGMMGSERLNEIIKEKGFKRKDIDDQLNQLLSDVSHRINSIFDVEEGITLKQNEMSDKEKALLKLLEALLEDDDNDIEVETLKKEDVN